MSAQGTKETLVRSVVGALIGLVIGLLLVVGTASYYANSIAALAGVVAVSVILCAVMAWRFGDRFIQSVHKLIQWLQ